MSSHTASRKPEAKYPFKELPSGNWIRILYLDTANTKDEPLIGRLENVDLKNPAHAATRPDALNGSIPYERHSRRSLVKYEALSWCWGSQGPSEVVSLRDKDTGKKFRFKIPPNLSNALRSLRSYSDDSDPRPLWVDAICINLDNKDERAHQVAQMNLVYGSASNVCIWLDDQPQTIQRYGFSTKEIFTFIEKDLLNLATFDEVISQRANARKWLALVQLMTKQWFTRRWVIQEIALARKATVHCGDAKMKWEKFAHAVSLFVKAESANHQLSEIVRKDETLDHKAGVFRDIDRMGAASLVEITTSNFNSVTSGIAQPVSSLESLMAMLPMFEASKPCDTIYSLLAIAKDTRPEAERVQQKSIDFVKAWKYVKQFGDGEEGLQKLQKACKVAEMLTAGLRTKPYIVSYSKEEIDVYQYFVEFCIYQSRSLDILCRPWAPKPEAKRGGNRPARVNTEISREELSSSSESDFTEASSDDSSDETEDDDEERYAIWVARAAARTGSWLGMTGVAPLPEVPYDSRDAVRSPRLGNGNEVSDSDFLSEAPISRALQNAQRKKAKRPHDTPAVKMPRGSSSKMPSWIADRQNTAFTLVADEAMTLMERKNADPLVGSPDNKPYRASGTREVRMGKVQFLRRSEYDQSLFVEGFVLDHIAECEQPSDLGNIPPSWFNFANFPPKSSRTPESSRKAPDDLYRTLIANRGLNGTRPPSYFPLAYSEALSRDRSITLDNRQVINEGKSIVTEFLERVRQVIFGRRLMKTATPIKVGKDGKTKPRLGLVPKDTRSAKGDRQGGDLICILYGLSVPVVLRRHVKTREEKEADCEARQEQLPQAYQKAVRIIETHWSFRKELEKAIYFMKEDDVKGKFSKLWLDKIKIDFEEKAKRSKNIVAMQTDKPERLKGNRTQEEQDELWKSMCEKWSEMLEHGHYKMKSPKVKDTPIKVSLKEGDDEYYEIIGEAYVDQMMDGEALSYKQEKKKEDKVFELR